MSHLDEGTLHALLDGELDGAETRQIEAHLGRCAACGTRLDEVKSVRTEAERLIGDLGDAAPRPEAPVLRAMPAGSSVGPSPRQAPVATAAPSASPFEIPTGPILLIPEPLDDDGDRRRRLRAIGWAAALLAVAGGGYLMLRRPTPAPFPSLASEATREAPSAPPTADSAVLGPEEQIGRSPTPDTTGATGQPADAGVGDGAGVAGRGEAKGEAEAEGDRIEESVTTATGARRPLRDSQSKQADGAIGGEDLEEGALRRLRAAAATADVDRVRNAEQERAERDRAELLRAEAAAESARRAAPRAAPAPPPTLEDRAGVYLRIGLDEAKRQLGSPMHVIEGMSPALVGLVQGGRSPGMDAARPVVRSVYVDPNNQLIFLDQQRIRTGQAPGPETQLRSIIDDVVVQLHGEPSVNVLRNLAARIQ